MLCLQSKKQAPCYSRLLGFKLIIQQLTRLSTGGLFSWRFADLYCTFSNKHCVSLPHHSQARGKNVQKQAHTFHATKSPQYVVERWIACSVLIRMSHQTVINENRMRVLIKGDKKCRYEQCCKTKGDFWQRSGAANSPKLRGTQPNDTMKINILQSTTASDKYWQ